MEKVKFYKEDDRWYADIKEHTKEENEMVCGADTFLDYLGKDTVTLTLCTGTPYNPDYYAHLALLSHDDDGAEYTVVDVMLGSPIPVGFTVWLCNVMHTVFGEHPQHIFIVKVL